jgi:hypothetical protein
MQGASIDLRRLPPEIADDPDAARAFDASPVAALSDAALIDAVAEAIAPPKRAADSSFLTHAPLELAARAALLPMVAPEARGGARRRIAAIAVRYATAGEDVDPPTKEFAGESSATAALFEALKDGDVDTLDAAAVWLGARVSPLALRRALAGPLLPMLGAAAHAPILLAELPRLKARLPSVNGLLRAPLRMIAVMSGERISWHERSTAAAFTGDAENELLHRLAAPPRLASPSPYIAPIMRALEAAGADALLGDVTAGLSVDAARRAILRAGAFAMLHDDAEAAPYGWTHALTMPQAVLALADVVDDHRGLVRIAATHAMGLRAVLSKRAAPIAPPLRPDAPDLFNVEPMIAAGSAYHAPEETTAALSASLATRAATHEDAHLAKYTLAAFDAGERDPAARPLFLAAAAYLGAWWDAHPGARFE